MSQKPTRIIESLNQGCGYQQGADPERRTESGREMYSDAYLILTLQVLEKELGRPPNSDDVRNLAERLPDVATYERRFGSWIGALEAAGIEGRNNRSDDTILRQLAALAVRLGGRQPTKREVDADPSVASSGLYTKRFGKFSEAVHLAMELITPGSDPE